MTQKKSKKIKKQFPSSFFIVLLLLIGVFVGIGIGLLAGSKIAIKWYDKNMQEKNPTEKACNAFTLVDPQKNQQVNSPLTVTVIIDNRNKNCRWTVFEAQAGTMKLMDSTGQTIGTGILSTTGDWMTEQPVTYTGTITFTKTPQSNQLKLIIDEENPSDQPGAQQIIIPLIY